MKQGSTDDPFAEDPFSEDATDEDVPDEGATDGDAVDENTADEASTAAESPASGSDAANSTAGDPFDESPADESHTDTSATAATTDRETAAADDATDDRDTDPGPAPQTRSLPYIHARDGVKDGRTQRPVFLRDHVESGIDDLVAGMEDELGEDVYKTDVTEAAMAVAQEHPDLVLAKLQEWGYGWR
jgi:hypothetical protein